MLSLDAWSDQFREATGGPSLRSFTRNPNKFKYASSTLLQAVRFTSQLKRGACGLRDAIMHAMVQAAPPALAGVLYSQVKQQAEDEDHDPDHHVCHRKFHVSATLA